MAREGKLLQGNAAPARANVIQDRELTPIAAACRVLVLVAEALNLPGSYFLERFKNPLFTLRPIHYTAEESHPDQGILGAGAHTDWGMLCRIAMVCLDMRFAATGNVSSGHTSFTSPPHRAQLVGPQWGRIVNTVTLPVPVAEPECRRVQCNQFKHQMVVHFDRLVLCPVGLGMLTYLVTDETPGLQLFYEGGIPHIAAHGLQSIATLHTATKA